MSQANKDQASKVSWQAAKLADLCVLLVHANVKDAEQAQRHLTSLQKPACLVDYVATPNEAAAVLEQKDYSLIVMGVAASLPETIAQFNLITACAPATPVIMLSNAADQAFSDSIIEHGAIDCLVMSDINDRMLRRVIRNAAHSKNLRQQIDKLEKFDSLTTLPNRAQLLEQLNKLLTSARTENRILAVLLMNLDRFKLINETLGPSRGDELIHEIGTRLRHCIPKSDLLARHHGAEFIVVSTGLATAHEAALVAQKMLNALDRPVMIDGQEIFITGSIGISAFPDHGTDCDTLIGNADAAMSRAKEVGRNQFHFYTMDMDTKTSQRLSLETELRRGLERGEFLLHYQPQFNLLEHRIVGLEALVRWQHPERGMVPPNDFIPMAEETGLIAPLGEWVLRTACAQAKAWHLSGHHNLYMAVNLSSRQFFQENVLDTVKSALRDTDLPANCLELELTESCVMQKPEEAAATLRQLRDMGIRLAIDDFGTGHSSLNNLKRFPVDCLKIDRSFIKDVTKNPEDGAIVQAVIAMAHGLGLKTVAEGVETLEQLRYLEFYTCDIIQGYLLSRPITAEQITQTFLPANGMSPDILPFGVAAANGSASRG